ncbi:MAG TPA: NAD(P)H-hydrate dehydratase, partial [Candidatus Limnocylindria bacterium]|nr:NAD(P)H-hydrate dehydratase [Candidatus Limnocylindria bacterium]
AYDAIVVGPGLGRHAATLRRTAHLLGELRRPVVVDADGLTALAARDRWWRTLTAPAVLSPHPGEFARLMGGGSPPPAEDDDAAREAAAGQAARLWEHVVILKGANTVVAAPDGTILRSAVATPALATAGSGDVLAGAIGAMLAAGLDPIDAAGVAVAVHAAAGVLAEQRIGAAGVLASDVARLLPEAISVLRGGSSGSGPSGSGSSDV